MAIKRKKGGNTGPGNQSQLRFNEHACSDKHSEAGYNYFWGASNAEGLLGALSTQKAVPNFRPILVVNTDAAVQYVAMGDTGLAAPAAGATGIPIAPGDSIVLNSGDNGFIRASAATVFGYIALDDDIKESADQL